MQPDYCFMRAPIKSTLVLLLTVFVFPISAEKRKPNIVVIMSDDQGYADVSFNEKHPEEVFTPHIDQLAKSGIRCTSGYASAYVCSPTRAGLMTGRYQQRFGIYTAGEGGSGVPLDEKFLPQYLKPAGYTSAVVGKWHMGLTSEYNPINRGFDEFYGFMGRGAHDYFKLDDEGDPVYRGLKPIKDQGYLTTRITEEAVSFIKRNKDQSFFLYVAYSAVHAPAQAPKEDIKNITGDEVRDTLLAMLKHLDNGVGQIVNTLKKSNLFENTLLIYLSDNGGSKVMSANNAPLHGYKQETFEGGVRVPFIVSWPAKLKQGATIDVPLISIDILPTVLAAAGIPLPQDRIIDGKNMLPVFTGNSSVLHKHLYWSSGGRDAKWGIRSGEWKLVGVKGEVQLFNLDTDIGESENLASAHPELVSRLTKLYDKWLEEMGDPVSGAPKRWNPEVEQQAQKNKKKKAERARIKQQRKQQKSSP